MRTLPLSTHAFLAGVAFALSPQLALGSCGSAFCVLNTNWDTLGVTTQPGKMRLDLRYEFIKQDQLRDGNRNISQAEDTSDTTEIETLNRNLLATLDYSFDDRWAVSVALPMLSRSHSHIADPTGTATFESWKFSGVGDARVLGRYQFSQDVAGDARSGLQFGLKLPTGDIHVANAEGAVAERALQPGTGSTDGLLGAYYVYQPHGALGWSAQVLYQKAVTSRDNYRPGAQLSATLGLHYPLSETIGLLLQFNGLTKARDSGANAEPDLSGGRYLFASPGMSYMVNKDVRVYGFVQQALYRKVNGVQLTADTSFIGGLSLQF